MRIAIVLLVLLPVALSLTVEERDGGDIIIIIKTLSTQMGPAESEKDCETQLCPPLIVNIVPDTVIGNIVCKSICQQAKTIAKQLPHRK